MDAKFCDRCNMLWVDKADCKVDIRTVILSYGNSHSDRVREVDLCDNCRGKLLEFLDPINE